MVYLKPPSGPEGPSTAGVAVLDSGEFLGQRVEFDRDVCSVFGLALTRADLSRVFNKGNILKVSSFIKTFHFVSFQMRLCIAS